MYISINNNKFNCKVVSNSKDIEKGMMGSRLKKPNYKSGGKVSASSRADGCAMRGKTKGKIV